MEESVIPLYIIYCQKFHPLLFWHRPEHHPCPVPLLWLRPSSLSRVAREVEGFLLLGFVFILIFNRLRLAVQESRWEFAEPHSIFWLYSLFMPRPSYLVNSPPPLSCLAWALFTGQQKKKMKSTWVALTWLEWSRDPHLSLRGGKPNYNILLPNVKAT